MLKKSIIDLIDFYIRRIFSRSGNRYAFGGVYLALFYCAIISIYISTSILFGSIFFEQVNDRVITHREVSTLAILFIFMIVVMIVDKILESLRISTLKSVAFEFDLRARSLCYNHSIKIEKQRLSTGYKFGLISDIDGLKSFFEGRPCAALFDTISIPLYILLCFTMHTYLGLFVIIYLSLVSIVVRLKENSRRLELGQLNIIKARQQQSLSDLIKNHELIKVSGNYSKISMRYTLDSMQYNKLAKQRSSIYTILDIFYKTLTTSFSGVILSVAMYLVIMDKLGPGNAIGIMLISGKIIQPVLEVSSYWNNYIEAKISYVRLRAAFADIIVPNNNFKLHRPFGKLDVSDLQISTSVKAEPILSGVNFSLSPGAAMGVIGPSGAGKSILARALIGILSPSHGTVRLDGAEMQHWDADQLGLHLGYLPQNVELLSGTIAENIARFGEVDDAAVLEAAKLAGVHDVIQGLPQGYNTQVGEGGSALSGGQRQRVGLARAIYGNPALIVLDEPNSDLDAIDESALAEALKAMKERGTTCILITHKANILKMVDFVLVLKDGTMSAFGPRDRGKTDVDNNT